jgi:DNA-binding CsgD family transcriptional regulator
VRHFSARVDAHRSLLLRPLRDRLSKRRLVTRCIMFDCDNVGVAAYHPVADHGCNVKWRHFWLSAYVCGVILLRRRLPVNLPNTLGIAMPGFRLRDFEAVQSAPDSDALEARLISFADHLSFERLTAVVVDDRPGKTRRVYVLGNEPEAYATASSDIAAGLRDPVVKRMKAANGPVAYDQSTYVQGNAGDLWETQAPFGYATGIAIAMHTGIGMHFYLGVARSSRYLPGEVARARLIADLHLLATYAQPAACRVFEPPIEGKGPVVKLTPRECECLSWARKGKSAWDTGMILGISTHTVEFHLGNARRKIGIDNTQLAAVRAMELHLVS